ncbi:MAG: universal stress protein [Dehalococcoidales bacterium]|nr:universal stress protein [Dehalococcoidales bacterium]
MFERILLPLDGSELAESALPYVCDLAGQLNAEVFLLHVCPQEHQSYLHMHQIYMNTIAETLTKRIAQMTEGHSLAKVQAEVITGDATKIIFDYVKLKSIGMVIITTYGTSGIRPWAMGNVADKIIRGAGVPTLLVRNKEHSAVKEQKVDIQKILLPLDNSDASKVAVPYAVELAKKLSASITLFSLTHTSYAQNIDGAGMGTAMGAGIGVNWDAIDAASKKYTDDFLEGIAGGIRQEGVQVNHDSYIGMDAAFEILEMEKKIAADIVVMATRGRSQIARWALGSVAEKVLREGSRPILLINEKTG